MSLPHGAGVGWRRGGMAGGGSASTGGAESHCRAGPPPVPRRRMEFELLENDVLESLEDLGYVSGGGGGGALPVCAGSRGRPRRGTQRRCPPRTGGAAAAPEGHSAGQRLEWSLFVRAAPRAGLVMMPRARRAGF